MSRPRWVLGLDVGSTTVKAVLRRSDTEALLWSTYRRHDTRQAEAVRTLIHEVTTEVLSRDTALYLYVTGSGSRTLAPFLRGTYVQEVNAVSLAVERHFPEVRSVIELGGQDAKVIIFKEDPGTGRKKKIPSMNDKCAGGTGAVIEKITAKLGLRLPDLSSVRYTGVKIHPVAGKCGVFAETDINSLQKQGIPSEELLASLFESIVLQNLTVLTRGHTLMPDVLLLGGPNTFIPGLAECWRRNILSLWEERELVLPEGRGSEDLVRTPDHAQYFAALGAAEYGLEDREEREPFAGLSDLEFFISTGRDEAKSSTGMDGLCHSDAEREEFLARYTPVPFQEAEPEPGSVFRGFLGIDGGSTSTKAVLLDEHRQVAFTEYQLSRGNPIQDTIDIIGRLYEKLTRRHCRLEILGVGTTGYAKDILKDCIGADVALVETVAHSQAALHFYRYVDVICDVGGQDIKILILKDGRVVDFKLNTQCSAGNGYFLQGTAESFGFSVDQFADVALRAKRCPEFSHGCAVFLQSDIVDFQRLGWKPEEILAGLATVLPKNIWLYVSQIPNLTRLGTRFVLQGGTQKNLAAVKAQMNFIRARFHGQPIPPEIIVHRHTGEAGAIGAALEAARLHVAHQPSHFIGFDAVRTLHVASYRTEDTRCYFCKNTCLRTFIDISVDREPVKTDIAGPREPNVLPSRRSSARVPLAPGMRRLIVASCERGTADDTEHMKSISSRIQEKRRAHPNMMEIAAKRVWDSFHPGRATAAHGTFHRAWSILTSRQVPTTRTQLRIGIPRVLNLYQQMPFFSAYFESLGIPHGNLIYSDTTSDDLYREGARRGSIDPCFPSKVALAHVHNLLYRHHARRPLDVIFFPMVDDMPTALTHVVDSRACPTIVGTAESVKAALTKEENLFAKHGVRYLHPFVNLGQEDLAERQLWREFRSVLKPSRAEHRQAVRHGYLALERFVTEMQDMTRSILRDLEERDGLGIVVLGRPYHRDPGLHHQIFDQLQQCGYPILSQDFLPTDPAFLSSIFGDDITAGIIADGMDIRDVWKNSYSENTSRKVWAAKVTARHPRLVALEFSSFKCGHDAPVYQTLQEIQDGARRPFFAFKDMDENKPTGSIKIRIETITYFLARYQEELRQARTRSSVPLSSAVARS